MKPLLNRTIFLQLFAIVSMLMIIPSVVAFVENDYFVARTFLYSCFAGIIVYALIAIALSNITKVQNNFEKLISFILSYLFLPMLMAVPLFLSLDNVRFQDSWLQMVSAFTTTGFNLIDLDTSSTGSALQLWLLMGSWLGGLFFWICAISILLPLNISRFEIGAADLSDGTSVKGNEPINPIINCARQLIPIYIIITVGLWLLLTLAGVSGFKALLMAMSVISTSGFEPINYEVGNLFLIEAIIFLFFVFALSKSLFSRDINEFRKKKIYNDPEIRLAVIIVFAVTGLFFATSIFKSIVENTSLDFVMLLKHLWGIFFTVTSYLITMGIESKLWFSDPVFASGEVSTVALMGLTIIGGGVATSAGGVKLLRVYILYRNAVQEVDMMLHPNSIPSKTGRGALADNKNNRFMAWIFFMLFIAAIVAFTLIFSMFFDDISAGLSLSVSALTTTGPLFVNSGYDILLIEMNHIFKAMLGLAMILGRLEILVIIALISPSVWRN